MTLQVMALTALVPMVREAMVDTRHMRPPLGMAVVVMRPPLGMAAVATSLKDMVPPRMPKANTRRRRAATRWP